MTVRSWEIKKHLIERQILVSFRRLNAEVQTGDKKKKIASFMEAAWKFHPEEHFLAESRLNSQEIIHRF